jgi:hypothetical protein
MCRERGRVDANGGERRCGHRDRDHWLNVDATQRARYPATMCNLYSLTKGQAAIRDLFRAPSDRTGNMPLFPDYMASIVRRGADGDRELVMARWGMPGPPQFGGQPVTNIRNLSSPHWRRWLG